MKRFKDGLIPREMKGGYYKGIKLGQDVTLQKIDISNQIKEMITFQVELVSTTNTNKEIIGEGISYLTYNMRDVGNGIFGLKAAFEWDISEVVWQIEQNTKDFKDMLKVIYASQDASSTNMRFLAQDAYEEGKIADALVIYSELSQNCQNDFSVFLSLGIICLFYEKNKEKALDNFNKAIEIAKLQSDYYTSYALLHKALVLRDLDLLEEAEEFSKQAIDLSPDFTEAIYQNAQYNALLKKLDRVIPLISKIIHIDMLYCLKINNEKDFNGIRQPIEMIFEEISVPKKEGIKYKQKELDRKLYYFNTIINSIRKQDFDITSNFDVKSLKENKNELAYLINYDSILNTFVVDKCFSRLDIFLNHDISLLLFDCKEIRRRLGKEKQETADKLLRKNGNRSFSKFFLYLFASQFYAVPIGILISKYVISIGGYMGVPPGVLILEAVAVGSCFFTILALSIGPRLRLKRIYSGIQKKEHKLDKIIRMIERETK
ncbi:MAG: tetratricopeptide repeat protein [Candidatus Scalindua sp.]